MPFPDELLNPIEGPNPSGVNLRYDPVYDKIKEARREEDHPPPGMTERDRKVADNLLVLKLTQEVLTARTKDLQLAAWLTEALLKQKGFGGLKEGLAFCYGLTEKFWDTVYPDTARSTFRNLARFLTKSRPRPTRLRRSVPSLSKRAG
jgi:type VI secretion system protein ImpA